MPFLLNFGYVYNDVSRLGIFAGFAAFFFMEKTLRVLGGGEDDGHGHSHSHSHEPATAKGSGASPSVTSDGLRSRTKPESEVTPSQPQTPNGPSKLSAYLNLFGDFVHNM